MSEEQVLKSILSQLERIAVALEAMARPDQNYTPDYVRPIEEFGEFDWSSINATVVNADRDGPTHIQWNGRVYTRRSPSNKYDPAIWYSRAVGKDDNGDNEYARLITFRKITGADPLPEKAREVAGTFRQPGRPAAIPAAVTPPPAVRSAPVPPPQQPAQKPAMKLVSYLDYVKHAEQLTISKEAANWIARKAEVAEPSGDHSVPDSYLQFFYECKHAGMRFTEGWEHLVQYEFDTAEAITALPK